MTVLDVYLNDRKLCRAGVGSDGVLDAIVSWVKLSGPAATTARRLKKPLEEMRLHVGGLRGNTHRRWAERNVQTGDRVAIVVGSARAADPPVREYRRDPPHSVRSTDDNTTRFLNVDLDIWSSSPLDPLVKAFGKKMYALHVGKERRAYSAHLELARHSGNADQLIRRIVAHVEALPRPARRLWNEARARELNIGIQAGTKPYSFELRLAPETLSAAASVNARVGFTVYSHSPGRQT